MEKKRNQIFNYLYVLAIIMVVDDHTGNKIGILSNIFPYNSFYMPLFVFCSGYFYKKTSLIENIKHKTKKLLIPYVVWNIMIVFLSLLMNIIFELKWFSIPNVKQLILMIFDGPFTSLNGAAWFIAMLFWVSIFYNFIRKIFKDNQINDIILTTAHLILGFISVYLCVEGFATKGAIYLFILKIIFYIQFYHIGYMFKKYIEGRLLKCNKIVVCSICIFINIILILIYGNDINFPSTSYMGGFNYWYLPIITSMTGIIFYYEIMEFLSRKIGENRIINFISRNTFVVMQIHLFFANIPNLYIYFQSLSGNLKYLDFDIETFRNSAWILCYNHNALLFSFFFGLLGSLMVALSIEKIKSTIKDKI